ncbi:Mur ligase family protein [Oricola sp.]|uniref:Mur ligase family protein n=1 Tax=Oricola sp. TaxID=1979950 RepID=UPI003BAD269F
MIDDIDHYSPYDPQILLGRFHRRCRTFDNIVAITGSAGKTSTTRLIGAVLKTQGPTHVGSGLNISKFIIKRFARMNPLVRNWVQEVSGHAAEPMRDALDFIAPTISVVTNVGFDHNDGIRTRDDIARSKGQIVEVLPEDGIAILNADDERVLAMRERCRGKTITYGRSSAADVRCTGWQEGLPDRLSLTVSAGGANIDVHTRMIGEKWIPNILAAMACAHGLAIPLEQAATAIASVEPENNKDSVHEKDGITFVLDAYKGSFWTVPASLDIVAKAKATRRVVILGSFTYVPDDLDDILIEATDLATKSADQVVWYGPHGQHVAELGPKCMDKVPVFSKITDLVRFLDETLTAGDLVYIKSSKRDHLDRVWHRLNGGISCYRDQCGVTRECRRCRLLR